MSKRITILGAGPGGCDAAYRAARLGAEVTIVERADVGGVCLNWGCIPTKTLRETARLYRELQDPSALGLSGECALAPDMSLYRKRRDAIVGTLSRGILDRFRREGIRLVRGEGVPVGSGVVRVAMTGRSGLSIESDAVIIATGSRSTELPSCPFDGERILRDNDLLGLPRIPSSLLVVGGGVIGLEYAAIYADLGAKVTLVEAAGRLLPIPQVDDHVTDIIRRELKKRGVTIMTGAMVADSDMSDEGVTARLTPSSGVQKASSSNRAVTAERVLVAVGRAPDTAGLALSHAEVRVDDRGWIVADGRMRTSAPGIFAVGDVLGPERHMLAHVASAEGRVAAENALGGDSVMSYDVVPLAMFTAPEVGVVGRSEAQARHDDIDVRSADYGYRLLGRAHLSGDIAGTVRIVHETGSGRVLGMQVAGRHASELVAEGALAIRTGATVDDIAATMHAHPTFAEAVFEAASQASAGSLPAMPGM